MSKFTQSPCLYLENLNVDKIVTAVTTEPTAHLNIGLQSRGLIFSLTLKQVVL